jgi:uncharacterized protein (DUF1501 family)
VVVFLRGGADGLSLVPPVGDDGYHRARPQSRACRRPGPLRLDELFALNPALHELHALFQQGMLAVIHAAGSEDESRSHFEAQDLMEHGGLDVAGGWLGRWLRSRQDGRPAHRRHAQLRYRSATSCRRACAPARPPPPCARSTSSIAWLRCRSCCIASWPRSMPATRRSPNRRPAPSAAAIASANCRLGPTTRRRSARYAERTDGDLAVAFSHDLCGVAQLIKARRPGGACIDLGNWDSHFIQEQLLEPRMRAFSQGLGAFANDLGEHWPQTTVVVMSEFGRRVRENASLGTDHGRGGAMFVLGGGTPGGMHCAWPGLTTDALDGPGDLPVVHNYRDVLASCARTPWQQRSGQRLP